jgi:glucose/mannose-6-phosphate isomerase
MMDIQERFPENFAETLKSYGSFSLPREVKIGLRTTVRYVSPHNVVIAGLGGSAIGGDLVRRWQYRNLCAPLEVCRGYELPGYVDGRSLVLIVSYSGETEETLSCFVEAARRGAMIVGVASMGRLVRYCSRLGYPLIRVPAGYPPRSALPFIFPAIITILDKAGLLKDYKHEVEDAVTVLEKIRDKTRRAVPFDDNLAKKLVAELRGSTPVIYADRAFGEVALRWKNQFNENRKIHARAEVFPELNHNELVGWEGTVHIHRRSTVIILRDPEEDASMKSRIDFTRDILKTKFVRTIELYPEGKSLLAEILYFVYLGDMVSLYSALDAAVDPFETVTIHRIKDRLKETVDLHSRLDREIEEIAGK